MKKIFLVINLSFLICNFSLAAPNIFGPTGLLTMPNADVIDAHDYNGSLGIASWQGYGALNASLNGSPVNNLELGMSKFFSPQETPLDLNIKYKLWNYSNGTPLSIALGGTVGFASQSYVKAYLTSTYPSFSKNTPLLPSAAISIDNMGNTTNFHFLVGTEWILLNNFRLLPEIDLAKNPSFNIGGRVALNKMMRLDFYALLNNNSSYGVQLSFNSNPKILWLF
ncbi:MAG: hypothetical protein ABIJ26_01880 [Candidatus Margulisiibacteriota bacterium]|nr:hypothetical protein [Candidatus Margulisiibacteriota bacterium]